MTAHRRRPRSDTMERAVTLLVSLAYGIARLIDAIRQVR
jgi:hypothetical protein